MATPHFPEDTPAAALKQIREHFADIATRVTWVGTELQALDEIIARQAQQSPEPPARFVAPLQHVGPAEPVTPVAPAEQITPVAPAVPSQTRQQQPPQHQSHPNQPHQYQAPQTAPVPPPAAQPPPELWSSPQPTSHARPALSERVAAAAERGLVGKVLGGAGVAITLIGFVLLLLLAAQAGLLSPWIRVAGGGLLAGVLFGLGIRIGRDEERRPGAVALVATGVAAALFDVLAATAIYHWLSPVLGLGLAAVVAGGGFAVAHRWNSELLGLMVGIPLLALAPVVTGGVDELLVGFLLTYAAATVWIQLGRTWTATYVLNTVVCTAPLLAIAGGSVASSAFASNLESSDTRLVALLAGLNVLLAVGSAVALLRTSSRPTVLALTCTASLLPIIPLTIERFDRHPGVIALAGAALLLATVAVIGRRLPGVTHTVRVIWLAASAVCLPIGFGAILQGSSFAIALAASGVVLGVASIVTRDLSAPLRIAASLFTALAAVVAVVEHPLARLVHATDLPVADALNLVVIDVLLLAAVVGLGWSWMRVVSANERLTMGTGTALAALALATAFLVDLGAAFAPGDAGFRAGHAAATITWAAAASAGLVWARRHTGPTRTVTVTVSLSVIALAVGKLFLFDMATLDGVFRVLAFIVVGLLLLTLGVVYAQSLAPRSDRSTHDAITH